jgi:hypothetical protein
VGTYSNMSDTIMGNIQSLSEGASAAQNNLLIIDQQIENTLIQMLTE